MEFGFTEQHEIIRTEVRHLARKFDWQYWRELDRTGAYPHEFFNAFAASGWLGTVIPAEYGGSGLGVTEACIVLGEICASGAGTSGASPIHFSMFPPMPIILHGSEDMKQRYLSKIASGEMKLAFSVTEPNVGTDTTHIQTTAVRDGDDWLINGRKVWCTNAQNAERVLILTRTTPYDQVDRKTKGMTLFFAKMDRQAITIRPIEKMGRHAVDSNELFIDGLRVSHADLVGTEGEGFYHLINGLNPERIVIAAEAVGIGKAAIDKAVQYAKERVVFGRPIGQNQGIQFPLAEAYAQLEAAELMTFKAAWLYDQGLPCGKEANIAKLLAAEAACAAVDHAVQTHGGYGYAREFDVERLYREIRLYKIAPVSQQMVLNYLSEHVLGLPRSY
jgi:acyl-CoA dehydrogenase